MIGWNNRPAMSIQFKFRSSVNFETLDIQNRPSISVGELRGNILRGKFSHQQQGFDLVFSDAVTGSEYTSDDTQIPEGSKVIVKRVPGGTLPSVPPMQVVKDFERKELHNLCTPNGQEEEYDNLVAELCDMAEPNCPEFNLSSPKDKTGGNNKDEMAGLRLERDKIYSCSPGQAIRKGLDKALNEGNALLKAEEPMEFNKLPSSNFPDVQSSNLPLELKCPLCNTFFKEAVLIPCCQHSFCKKCIRQVLIDKGRCPKCSSNKCSVENLLPNLSLRQAIERFLESEMLNNSIENGMQKYVPDGESGIQAQDVSCAVTVMQRDMELPQSSCATGKGSNQVLTEGFHRHQHGRNVPHANFDFQGENQSSIPQANVPDEADSNTKRKGGGWNDSAGGGRKFSSFGGYRKGIRNCYTCGSPDHLMRDCPLSNQIPMFRPENGAYHGGMATYASPHLWSGSSVAQYRPYANMYSNPSVGPFNASMVHVPPFAAAHYNIPSMTGGLPGAGGNMRMAAMGPSRQPEQLGLKACENRRNENLGRELSEEEDDSLECYHPSGPEKSLDYKLQKDKEQSLSHSGDCLTRGLGRKSQHDQQMRSDNHFTDGRHDKGSHSSFVGRDTRPSHAERSNSGKDDLIRSSDRHSDGRRNHHHGDSKKYHEKRGHSGSDSSLGHYSTQREVKRKVESDVRNSHHKHHSLPESGLEPSSPNDRRGGYRERDTGHDSRHSKHGSKHPREEQHDDRRRMISGPDSDRRDEYRYHKRRAH